MTKAEAKIDAGLLDAPTSKLVGLARNELGHLSERRGAELFATLGVRRARQGPFARLSTGFALAIGVVALFFIAWHALRPTPTPLSYAVEGGRLEPNGTIAAHEDKSSTLRFSDGTELVFQKGASGQVRSVNDHGARIALAGKVDVDVAHWQGAEWLFDAGPFVITVKGTAFTAEWRAEDERLEIALRTGSVAVNGPLSDEAITLRAGQRLILSARKKEVVIRDLDAPEDPRPEEPSADRRSEAPAASVPSQTDDKAAAPALERAPAAPSSAPAPPSWSAELAAGRFASILEQAEARGLDAVLRGASSDDLSALADAARYSRRDDLARRALTAQRQRFPGSARAGDAAFLLGRLEESAQHPDLALGWYERCVNEGRGSYTSEAMGRKMTLVQRLEGAERARPIAEEYLRRFPRGTYAAAARALVRAP